MAVSATAHVFREVSSLLFVGLVSSDIQICWGMRFHEVRLANELYNVQHSYLLCASLFRDNQPQHKLSTLLLWRLWTMTASQRSTVELWIKECFRNKSELIMREHCLVRFELHRSSPEISIICIDIPLLLWRRLIYARAWVDHSIQMEYPWRVVLATVLPSAREPIHFLVLLI